MLPCSPNYTQLQPEDRVTLASLKQQGYGIRAMARVLDRSASTISRELQRNSTPAGRYASALAQQACSHRRAQSRPMRKLRVDSILLGVVEHFLHLHWSPEQVALALKRLYPPGHEYRVSHETIYNCIYAQPVGELRRDLIACRAARARTAAVRSPTCSAFMFVRPRSRTASSRAIGRAT